LFTTHDHEFAQTVANRVVELTPNGVIDRHTTFDEYMQDDKIKVLREKMYS
jgi:ATPase subunit of ABC transporter with duplicated ATPase domains